MTKVSYVVKKNGFKGSIKVQTYQDALAKAKEIGGYVKAVYSKIYEPMTLKELETREKRLEYWFGRA